MPENKLRQYDGRVRKRSNIKKSQQNIGKAKKNLKTIVETKKIQNSDDDSSLLMIIRNQTLDDSIWKDSFDRLLDARSPLRKNNIIRKDVRLSYNLDSSVNISNEKSGKQNEIKTKTKENVISNSFLNQTPIYKRKSFLQRFNDVMNRNERKKSKKFTISSTPLVNKARKSKRKIKSKSTKLPTTENDLRFSPVISPIRMADSPKFNESLLNSITSSEKKRIWKNDYRINLSELENENKDDDDKIESPKAKRAILNSLNLSENRIENKSNEDRICANCASKRSLRKRSNAKIITKCTNDECKNSISAKSRSAFKNINQNTLKNSLPEAHKRLGNHATMNNLNDDQNLINSLREENLEKNIKSLEQNRNLIIIQEVESILDKSLSNIEKSICKFDDNNCNNLSILENLSSQHNIELNQSLQVIEQTYHSILENAEILTPEIHERFNSIEKSLDNLLSNNKNVTDELNYFSTEDENSNANKMKSTSNESKSSDSVILNNEKTTNIFTNNAFINKLKFLQNCLAISNKIRRKSLPVIISGNGNNLIRSNSTNNINMKTSPASKILDPSILNSKNLKNQIQKNSEVLINQRKICVDQNFVNNDFSSTFCQSDNMFNSAEIRPLRRSLLENPLIPIDSSSSDTSKTQTSFSKSNLSNIKNTDINVTNIKGNISNNINIHQEGAISQKTRRKSFSNFKTHINTSPQSAESFKNKSKIKKKIRKFKSENFKLKPKGMKVSSFDYLPSTNNFFPLRKSLIRTDSESSINNISKLPEDKTNIKNKNSDSKNSVNKFINKDVLKNDAQGDGRNAVAITSSNSNTGDEVVENNKISSCEEEPLSNNIESIRPIVIENVQIFPALIIGSDQQVDIIENSLNKTSKKSSIVIDKSEVKPKDFLKNVVEGGNMNEVMTTPTNLNTVCETVENVISLCDEVESSNMEPKIKPPSEIESIKETVIIDNSMKKLRRKIKNTKKKKIIGPKEQSLRKQNEISELSDNDVIILHSLADDNSHNNTNSDITNISSSTSIQEISLELKDQKSTASLDNGNVSNLQVLHRSLSKRNLPRTFDSNESMNSVENKEAKKYKKITKRLSIENLIDNSVSTFNLVQYNEILNINHRRGSRRKISKTLTGSTDERSYDKRLTEEQIQFNKSTITAKEISENATTLKDSIESKEAKRNNKFIERYSKENSVENSICTSNLVQCDKNLNINHRRGSRRKTSKTLTGNTDKRSNDKRLTNENKSTIVVTEIPKEITKSNFELRNLLDISSNQINTIGKNSNVTNRKTKQKSLILLKDIRKSLENSIRITRSKTRSSRLSHHKRKSLNRASFPKVRNILTKQLEISKVQNETKTLEQHILNKSKLEEVKNPKKSINESIITLSPEVLKFRKVKNSSITLRQRIARSKLNKYKETKIEKPVTNHQKTITRRKISRLKKCNVNIKDNKNVENKLTPNLNQQLGNNVLEISEEEQKFKKLTRLRKCKISIKKNKNIQNKVITHLNEEFHELDKQLLGNNCVEISKDEQPPQKLARLRKCKVSIKENKYIQNKIIAKSNNELQNSNSELLTNSTLMIFKDKDKSQSPNLRTSSRLRKFKNIILPDTKISKEHITSDSNTNPKIQINNSEIEDLDKVINTMSNQNNTITLNDSSIMEISFDRDEFIKNIEKNQIKTFLQPSNTIPLQPSLSHRTALVNLTNNITLRDSINRSKKHLDNSITIKSVNIINRNSRSFKNSISNINNSLQDHSSIHRTTNLMYDTLYEDSEMINNNSTHHNNKSILNENKNSLILSSGKWRRSLCEWKRKSISLSGKINSSQLSNTEFGQNRSDINKTVEILNRENIENNNSNVEIRRNTASLSNQSKLITRSREFNSNLKNSSVIRSAQNGNEISFNGSQRHLSFLRKTLLLEPTDDEAPIIHTSCSLFNTFEKQSKSSSSSSTGAAETAAPCVQQNQSLQSSNQNQQTNQQLQQNFIEKPLQRQKQKPPSSSVKYPEIVEETEEEELQIDDDSEYNPSDGDVEYFNDQKRLTKSNKNNNSSKIYKQKSNEIQKSFYVQRRTTTGNHQQQKSFYQHQLSLPLCGNRQSISILGQPSNRRRRTSFIEGFVDFNYQQEQRFLVDNFVKETEGILSTATTDRFNGNTERENQSFHIKSPKFIEFKDDEKQLIFCPTLDVSLRAQLSPRDILLRRCQQIDPFDFSTIYSESSLRQCRKIGEGVYGEVFMKKNENGEAIVLKIIPIEGQFEVNGEVQKNFEQILPEIIISEELSYLRNDKISMTSGFVEVKNVHCVQGCYPDHLIDLWELYRDNCSTENDHPEVFPEDQLYIVLELANAGQDLEAFNFQNALQAYSAFLQLALSLAVAEEKFKFEHRDLHWGNILLQTSDQKEIYFKLSGKDYKIPTHGVKATIIDYTLSRMIFEGCCLYNDLSNDSELFSASGDYQFDIYRSMKKRLDNQWKNYDPYTNILWLHYAIDKMISGVRYRCSKTKKHRSAIQTMMKLRDELLDYNSASDYVESFDD